MIFFFRMNVVRVQSEEGYFTANYEVINYFMRIFSKDKKKSFEIPFDVTHWWNLNIL